MDTQRVDMFMVANMSNFPAENTPFIRERLLAIDDSKWGMVSSMQWKSPTTALVLSLFLGSFGIDRFYIGDNGIGVGKLLTCGAAGIWTIIDWFLIMGKTREKNYSRLIALL